MAWFGPLPILHICCVRTANILLVVIGHVSCQSSVEVAEQCYRAGDSKLRCFLAPKSSTYLKSWHEARDWCLNQTDGYTLATVRDEATQEALVSFLTDHELIGRNVWIGASQKIDSRWTWINGSTEPGASYSEIV